MIIFSRILGLASDAELAVPLRRLENDGRLEVLFLAQEDIARRRLRRTTNRGTECAIKLARQDRLFDGAVLDLDDHRAIVVRVRDQAWLRFAPRDAAAALALGYLAGNLHWKVRFEDGVLLVAPSGPADDYLNRVSDLVSSGAVSVSHA